MRLLIVLLRVNRENTLYGAERSTLELAEALSSEGIITDIIQWHNSAIPIATQGLHVYRIDQSVSGWLGTGVVISKLASQTKSDYIYAYAEYFPDTIVASVLASILSRKSLLVSVLDDQQKQVDKRSIGTVFSTRLANGHSFRSSLRYAVFQLVRRIAVRFLATTVVSTDSVAKYAQESLDASNIIKIGRGVDNMWFGRNTSEFEFDVASVGGLWKHKRVDVLIQAWKLVTAQLPRARLLIVGDGSESQRLHALADQLGILRNITFEGYVEDPKKIKHLLSRSRAFVSTSEMEGYGRSTAEANAIGLPCVLSDIPVFRELYSNNAILVKPGEPNLLASAILDLLMDEKKYNELAQSTTENAGRLSWGAVARRLVSELK